MADRFGNSDADLERGDLEYMRRVEDDPRPKTPPLRIGTGVLVNYRQSGDHFIILCYLPDNNVTPFVVAAWYPWHGSSEWHQGNYFTDASEAVKRFFARR